MPAPNANPASLHDNKRATEYLANERTFLAWIRTSIAVLSLGFVVAKFSVWLRELALRFSPGTGTAAQTPGASLPIGISMMAFGATLALLAAWRYHRVHQAIERGEVTGDPALVLLLSLTVALLALVKIGYMLTTSEQS